MALTTSAWGRPIQGVSQQPPKVRLEGQCSVQENAISSVVNGLVKRMGTRRVGYLSQVYDKKTAYYYYNRGDGEKYFVILPPNSIPKVFDIQGREAIVENELGDTSYVKMDNPRKDSAFSTISDFTFIVNKKVTPKRSAIKTEKLVNRATVEVRYADYGRDYSVSLDGNETNFHTPDGAQAYHSSQVSPTYVARVLETGSYTGDDGGVYGSGLNSVSGFDVYREGNIISIKKTDGSDFVIESNDSADGGNVVVVKDSVTNVSDLPRKPPVGTKIEVLGEANSTSDNYWLEAESKSGDAVKWVEAVGPDQSSGIDDSTMPVSLIRDRFSGGGVAVFKLKETPWGDRGVGTEDTNKDPSFIEEGLPITSVGTFQNRLYLTAGESVIYSRSNEFFELYRRSVRTPLDDDPIDVYADTRRINTLETSAVLDGDVVFFSKNGQFLQSGDEPVTKENATLQSASAFENEVSCNPKPSGDVIFFAFRYGLYAGVREFYTDSFTDTKRARPVTDHVDEYLTGSPLLLATSTNKNQLLVLTDRSDKVYVYNWLWQGQERVQSSWSTWDLGGTVRFIEYDDDIIYFLIERGDNLELEFLETGDPDDRGLDFPVRLDAKEDVVASFNGSYWEMDDPYPFPGKIVAVRGEGCLDEGVSIDIWREGGKIKTEDPLSEEDTVNVILGIPYKMRYEPTMPFVKDRDGKVIDTDRLILNDVNVNYDKTGLTFVYVENKWGGEREYSFNGRKIGDVSNIVGFSPLRPGQFTFPVRQESDRCTFTIETESHIPFQLRGMEWRGRFTQRGRRV